MAVTSYRRVLLIVATGVLLYVVLHFQASRSEAFQFIAQTIRSSAEVHSRVGDVQQVRLGIFDSFNEKFAGSYKWANMTVIVVGNKGTIKARVKESLINLP